ncbi:MAG TPA: hypothetical protein DIT05_02630 [Morganella sp. (in: Bacteria)]|nr:hypothetical protein [Morganella sp. (in: enterobacteria)]
MKKICFFDLPFTRHDTNAPRENKYHRIIAGGNVFYTFSSQYENTDVLEQLQTGDRLYLGARPLADGSYWLHWLVSPDHGELKPATAGTGNLISIIKLITALMLIILSICFFFTQLLNTVTGVTLMFVCVAGCLLLKSAVQSLLVTNNRAMKFLADGLAQVKAGNTGICCQSEYLLSDASAGIKAAPRRLADERFNDLDSVRPEDYRYAEKLALTSVNGTVSQACAARGSTGSGRYSRDYIEYQFACSDTLFTLRNYYNTFTDDLNPFFFRTHPFFIADGDPLALTVNGNNGAIIGIYNERDNNAYIKLSATAVSLQQIKTTYKAFAAAALFFLLMAFIVEIQGLLKINGMPDKWDWLSAAETIGGVMLMMIIVLCSLLLVSEIIVLLMRKYFAGAARVAFTRQLLVQFRLHDGKNSTIQEMN